MDYAGEENLLIPPNCSKEIKVKVSELPTEILLYLEKTYIEQKTNVKWNEIKHQVQKFLRAFPSLNSALKEWPEIKMYIPQKYIDKVNYKIVRPKSTAVPFAIPEIDRSMITTHGIVATLGAS
jgi:hypothetical protein